MIVIKKDLRALFGAVRNQGQRPTCLAFAASDTHAALRNPWDPLSCEYLFFHAQQRAGRPNHVGALLKTALEVLRDEGQPREASWAYLPKIPPAPYVWQPPNGISPLFRRNGQSVSSAFGTIVSELDKDRPVIVLTRLSHSFYVPDANGIVDPPGTEIPDPTRRHAVVAVGHGEVNKQPAILIRNSWGPKWATQGYGWLTENFLKPRVYAIAILMEDLSVSTTSAAA